MSEAQRQLRQAVLDKHGTPPGNLPTNIRMALFFAPFSELCNRPNGLRQGMRRKKARYLVDTGLLGTAPGKRRNFQAAALSSCRPGTLACGRNNTCSADALTPRST